MQRVSQDTHAVPPRHRQTLLRVARAAAITPVAVGRVASGDGNPNISSTGHLSPLSVAARKIRRRDRRSRDSLRLLHPQCRPYTRYGPTSPCLGPETNCLQLQSAIGAPDLTIVECAPGASSGAAAVPTLQSPWCARLRRARARGALPRRHSRRTDSQALRRAATQVKMNAAGVPAELGESRLVAQSAAAGLLADLPTAPVPPPLFAGGQLPAGLLAFRGYALTTLDRVGRARGAKVRIAFDLGGGIGCVPGTVQP